MVHATTSALMRHAMREKLKKQNQVVKAALAGQRAALSGVQNMQMTETRIYVGLNDAETREQLYDTEIYLKELKEVCKSHRAAFSVDVEQGGYYHEDGTYTEETSLVLVLIDAERDVVRRIAEDLRRRFHQESVLVTEDRIKGCYVTEVLSE